MRLDVEEALRYMGGAKGSEGRALMEQTAQEVCRRVRPRWAYRVYTVEKGREGVCLPEADLLLRGETARSMLAECSRAAVMVCTLGVAFDQWLHAEQARDMVRAVMIDACGSAWVEAGCEEAEKEIAERFPGQYLTDRFSPGYGDLPLRVQKRLCAAVDSQRRLGVYVTDSCLLNPQKSVTAIIGIADRPQAARIRGCAYCSMRETCALRKGGKSCGNQ